MVELRCRLRAAGQGARARLVSRTGRSAVLLDDMHDDGLYTLPLVVRDIGAPE
jgi:hypothetical protein